MSLNFRYTGKENTKTWTKYDWQTYNMLVWATMSVDLNALTEKNIYEFVRRFNINNFYDETFELKDGTTHRCRVQIKVKDIRKFVGLKTNASNLTANQWAIKHFGNKASDEYCFSKFTINNGYRERQD